MLLLSSPASGLGKVKTKTCAVCLGTTDVLVDASLPPSTLRQGFFHRQRLADIHVARPPSLRMHRDGA